MNLEMLSEFLASKFCLRFELTQYFLSLMLIATAIRHGWVVSTPVGNGNRHECFWIIVTPKYIFFCSSFLRPCQGNQLIESIFYVLFWILKMRSMIFDRYYFERVDCIQCPRGKVIRGIPRSVKIKISRIIVKNFRGENGGSRR